jgi:hypothetical protein
MYEQPVDLQHSTDVLSMIGSGDIRAAAAMHAAYVQAAFELEDRGAKHANMLDLWLAGVLLCNVASC